jgi:putative PIN family toxin of toxin-antitoxin system
VTRVTLDTNELISAFNFRGKALELIHLAINGEIEIAISEPILQETTRVLRDKFEWNPYELRAPHDSLMKICKLVEPKHIIAVVADEPDNRILECSEGSGFGVHYHRGPRVAAGKRARRREARARG